MVLDSFAPTGRVAFVTGAGSGIGQRPAAAYAEADADVACFDRDQAGLDLIVDGGYVCC